MDQMTSPKDFDYMTDFEVREFVRECSREYRSEKSRRHMARQANLNLIIRQHRAAIAALRLRPLR